MENSMAVANGRQLGRFEAAPATTKRLSLYCLATMYIVLTSFGVGSPPSCMRRRCSTRC